MRKPITWTAVVLLASAGALAQSPQPNWPPILAWSASSFDCPGTEGKKEIENAALNGDADAQTKFGKAQFHSCPGWKNPVESLQFLNLAAEKNNVQAQITLGEIYRDGKDVPRDLFEASRWFARAAKQEDPRALNNLGVSNRRKPLQETTARRKQLFLQAAGKGLPEAQYNLGTRYELGLGVRQNYQSALQSVYQSC